MEVILLVLTILTAKGEVITETFRPSQAVSMEVCKTKANELKEYAYTLEGVRAVATDCIKQDLKDRT